MNKKGKIGKRLAAWFLCLVVLFSTVNLSGFTIPVQAKDYPTTITGYVGIFLGTMSYDLGVGGKATITSGEMPPGVEYEIDTYNNSVNFSGTPKKPGTYNVTFNTEEIDASGAKHYGSFERTFVIGTHNYVSFYNFTINTYKDEDVYFVGSDENFVPGEARIAPGCSMPSGLSCEVDSYGRVHFLGTPNEIGKFEVTFKTIEYPDGIHAFERSFTREIRIYDDKKITIPKAPSITTFATETDLTDQDKFTLYRADGVREDIGKAQKVYFGKDKSWYIAGKDTDDSLVLMCDPETPFGEKAFIAEDKYNSDYINNETYEDKEVYANHYGASDLRAYLNGEALDVFTEKEKEQIKAPVIYTEDKKNNCIYATADKLYLPYTDTSKGEYIIVGSNSESTLTDGIKIGIRDNIYAELLPGNAPENSPYNISGSRAEFFLRATYNGPYNAQNVIGTTRSSLKMGIASFHVNITRPVLPALNIDLSNVLFASTVATARTNATISDAMTLRFNGEGKVCSEAKVYHDCIQITYSPNARDEYIYILYNDGREDRIISKAITGKEIYNSETLGLESFDNCKIWIEKYDEASNLTYAVMAEEPNYVVDNGLIYELFEGDNGLEAELAGPFDMTGKIVVNSVVEKEG